MPQQEKQGVIAQQQLTQTDIAAIEQLVTVCSTHAGSPLHFFSMDTLTQRSGNETLDFLYYEQGQLVGYSQIDNYGTTHKEFSGIVHPDYRRRGIASQLLQAVKEAARQSGVEQLLLTCERAFPSGAAFAAAIHAKLDNSEHTMVLRDFKERLAFDERVTFRQATSADDFETIAAIRATDRDGDGNIEQARAHVAMVTKRAGNRFYLMTFGGTDLGCDEAIGSLRLHDGSEQIGIYGVVVKPEYRGRGYGRQLLQEAIRVIRSESTKEIMLEVDVDNTNAFGLYRSCGFEIVATFDYYAIEGL